MSEASDYKIDFRPIEGLIPYIRNARTHSDAQVAQIAASIVEFGWTNPVLADATGIVAGHGRVLAARKLYEAGHTLLLPNDQAIPKGCVPVLNVTGWSEAQRKAYILADNQLALNAGWDESLLKLEIEELKVAGFDLPLIGFDEKALVKLFPVEPLEPDDEEPDEDPSVRIIRCPKCAHDFSVLEQMTKSAKRRKKA